jgi:hypothetical protein
LTDFRVIQTLYNVWFECLFYSPHPRSHETVVLILTDVFCVSRVFPFERKIEIMCVSFIYSESCYLLHSLLDLLKIQFNIFQIIMF